MGLTYIRGNLRMRGRVSARGEPTMAAPPMTWRETGADCDAGLNACTKSNLSHSRAPGIPAELIKHNPGSRSLKVSMELCRTNTTQPLAGNGCGI